MDKSFNRLVIGALVVQAIDVAKLIRSALDRDVRKVLFPG
jgi:hypothetical protein